MTVLYIKISKDGNHTLGMFLFNSEKINMWTYVHLLNYKFNFCIYKESFKKQNVNAIDSA